MSLSWESGGLELAVADDGPGFADAALARDALRPGGSRQPGVKLRRQHDENAILC